jgi:hypothetical protein
VRRLIFIVEGDSEKEFVDTTLRNYLAERSVYNISCYKISKTNGGLTSYGQFKNDVKRAVNEANVLVTTLIDFYALPQDFPGFKDVDIYKSKTDKVTHIEEEISKDIMGQVNHPALLPYIQLHEFEALTFTTLKGFREYFDEDDTNFSQLEKLILSDDMPEDINGENPPSKRLKKMIKGYNKVVDGNSIIRTNGIELVIQKCPRFRNWINSVVEKVKQ